MKTFREHLKEDKSASAVNVQTSNAVEDGSLGTANLKDQRVLDRVNAFVGSVGNMEYIKPQFAVDKLRENLMRIGLDISPMKLEGTSGTVTGEVKQFGGTYGKTTDTKPEDVVVDNGPGIDNLKLEVKYETLSNGSSKVYAKLV
jgi:hypothetical protein|tara:strand:- start:986 stop:1417 length:432 start_codon:yes stop_codon:yes gene_type:complete